VWSPIDSGDLLMIRRREFIAGLGGAAAWPVAAGAQLPHQARRVSCLYAFAENDPETRARVAVFREGLAQLGWTERNVWSWADAAPIAADGAAANNWGAYACI
jgi:hypothetical protein